RINATIPPASVQGSTLTIRKFRDEPYSIIDLIERGTVDVDSAAFLWLCVEGLRTRPANILISGGTGSGKTTTLNVMASFIPDSERVITIEDTAELNLPIKHWIRMESRPPGLEGTGEITLDLLTKNSLRMRPDRIIVGEVRGKEAFSLFTAFNTGHDGSLGTVHANSPQETIVRVTSPPMNVPEIMMSGLNFIIVQHRLHDRKIGTIRRVTEIAEVTGVLEGKARTQAIYIRDAKNDRLIRTKTQSKYLQLLADMTGSTLKQIDAEINTRASFLKKLIKEKKSDMKTVSEEFNKYLMKG
ncbi:CpaF family protein, partial [archaeon]|nr:CpaF family protein [archaeon]